VGGATLVGESGLLVVVSDPMEAGESGALRLFVSGCRVVEGWVPAGREGMMGGGLEEESLGELSVAGGIN